MLQVERPRLLVLQHDADDGLKLLAEPLLAAGLELEVVLLAKADPPSSLAGFRGLVVLGAVACLSDAEEPSWLEAERRLLEEALELATPTLGICFGAQHLAVAAGGHVAPAERGELGWQEVAVEDAGRKDQLVGELPSFLHAFQWHYDAISLPPSAELLATGNGFVQAFRCGPAAWGLQFHLEVDPGGILSWQASAGEELERAGITLATLSAETDAYAAANAQHALALASAFAAAVLRS